MKEEKQKSKQTKTKRGECRVTKVREFQRVAKLCEADGHMQQKLKQLLKLSKEKWDAACEHAKTAVQVHSRVSWTHISQHSAHTRTDTCMHMQSFPPTLGRTPNLSD